MNKQMRAAHLRATSLPLSVLGLGDYIDLPSLTVEAYNSDGAINATNQATTIGRILRLIVVGINAYSGKNGNGSDSHLVFQFQNVPGTRKMNATDTNVGGYNDNPSRVGGCAPAFCVK